MTKHGPVGEERNPVVWWLLSMVCFIVGFYWIYKVWTEIAEFTKKEEIDPTMKVVFMLIPILNIITLYQMYDEIAKMEESVGISEEERLNPIVNLLLTCVLGIGYIFAQQHLNTIWEKA
ncbi:MAG: hypothetical protein JRJ70_17170 [Deltaproteobacteria bacterium]|nr:hypothetical protein [Deltaproteobacteria bacterium]